MHFIIKNKSILKYANNYVIWFRKVDRMAPKLISIMLIF